MAPPQQEQGGREGQDVEQIMREIRGRIAQRHGIELTTQQIQELAARRLEAILDPRTVNPSLLEQLRRNAAKTPDFRPADATPAFVFEDRTIYESHNAVLRFLRKLLNPILKLFFNPNPIAHALNTQARLNAEIATREADRDRQQAEWNALHYDILQRLVTETARVSIEMQGLASRVESLGARVDFADRRVRAVEASAQPSRPQQQQRQADPRQTEPRPIPSAPAPPAVAPPEEALAADTRAPEGVSPDGGRRRRRRRRGRRSPSAAGEGTATTADAQLADSDADGGDGGGDFDDAVDGETPARGDAAEVLTNESGSLASSDRPAWPRSAPEPETPPAAAEQEPPPAAERQDVHAASVAQPTAAAAPPPFPLDESGAATTPPSPPRDEPAPAAPEPSADKEPVDR